MTCGSGAMKGCEEGKEKGLRRQHIGAKYVDSILTADIVSKILEGYLAIVLCK